MPVWIEDILAPLTRYLVAILAGWLVKVGVEAQDAKTLAAGLIGVIVPILWAIISKRLSRDKVTVALSLPAGSTEAHLKEALALDRSERSL